MSKIFTSSPLPFQGQKRMWHNDFKREVAQFKHCDVFVDLFGGSGLLSRMVKDVRPDATVIYNDFDDFHVRVENIAQTNKLLAQLRDVLADCPRLKLIPEPTRSKVLRIIREADKQGFVDYITLSASLLFSGKYATSYEQFKKFTFYNTIKHADYEADGYLNGLDIVKEDYRVLFERWKHYPNVCFLIDPPYLATDVKSYTNTWGLQEYLNVLLTLHDTNYFYFTSNKSQLIELCDWMQTHAGSPSPFRGATRIERSATVNGTCGYTDIMLFKNLHHE